MMIMTPKPITKPKKAGLQCSTKKMKKQPHTVDDNMKYIYIGFAMLEFVF